MPKPSLVALLASLCAAITIAQDTLRDVPPGREVAASKLLSPGLTDVWRLDAAAGEFLWCKVSSESFDPVLELFDASGQRLGSDDGEGTSSALWLCVPSGGAVELRVHGIAPASGGAYSFWLQRARTEELASAGTAEHTFGAEQWWHYRVALRAGDILVPSVGGDGRLTAVLGATDRVAVGDLHGGYAAPRDGDYLLRVEGPERRPFRITTQLARLRELPPAREADDTVPPFGFDVWRLRLEAGTAYLLDVAMPDAQLEVALRECAPDGPPAFVVPGHLDKGGRRHRWLLARRACEVELMLRNRAARPAPHRVTVTEPERALALGVATEGRLARGDGDLYALRAVAGELLRIRVASDAFDAQCDVWDESGAVIAQAVDDRGPLDRDAEHTFLVPRAACYRVLVYTPGGVASGDYTIEVESVRVTELRPGERESIELGEGTTHHAHLALEAGEEVWLSVRSRSFDAALTVLDPAGNAWFTSESGGRGGDVLVAYVASFRGRHTLLVHSRAGSGPGELRVLAP